LPFNHEKPLHDGQVCSITRDGEIEWSTDKRLGVVGSYDAKIHVKSDISTRCPETGLYQFLVFDGNPVKFLQGHNLFGDDDIIGIMSEVVLRLCNILCITPSKYDWEAIKLGAYKLNRVDSTMMIDLGSKADVDAFIYSAERTAHMKYKGQGILTGKTLYFGKHSRRESLKMYPKGHEIRAKGHELPQGLRDLPELYNWADSKLRIEVCTRAMQLKDDGLSAACNWTENTPDEKVNQLLKGLNMSDQHTLTGVTLDGLPPRLVAVYHMWKEGHDLKKMYLDSRGQPSKTFYRYRKALLANGIDIAVKQGNRAEPAPNVIEFRRVLRPERCEQIPSWAIGTVLYFEPRRNFPSYEELFKQSA
jgi:II/X family phage/plasmid replication protein